MKEGRPLPFEFGSGRSGLTGCAKAGAKSPEMSRPQRPMRKRFMGRKILPVHGWTFGSGEITEESQAHGVINLADRCFLVRDRRIREIHIPGAGD
jgi:hypothetical protein